MNPYSTATQGAWTTQVKAAATDEMEQQTGYAAAKMAVAVTPIVETGGFWRVKVEAATRSRRSSPGRACPGPTANPST
jgi:hypothetical protein